MLAKLNFNFDHQNPDFTDFLLACHAHSTTNEFPIEVSYQVNKRHVEIMLYRHGFTDSIIFQCEGCGCETNIHKAVTMHVVAQGHKAEHEQIELQKLSNLELGCSVSNMDMNAQALPVYRKRINNPYVSKNVYTEVEAQKAAKVFISKKTLKTRFSERLKNIVKRARGKV